MNERRNDVMQQIKSTLSICEVIHTVVSQALYWGQKVNVWPQKIWTIRPVFALLPLSLIGWGSLLSFMMPMKDVGRWGGTAGPLPAQNISSVLRQLPVRARHPPPHPSDNLLTPEKKRLYYYTKLLSRQSDYLERVSDTLLEITYKSQLLW